ncbi:hypothetical protein VCSRO12_3565 [Vibrio cholerae]|uniref:hypothetical protein n=1 Tax=Vibrio cholerae TaxID=666 RepID=UPI0000EF99CD|nr:hypothetical protein [Vibrio cholerae]ELQ6314413.1 hypothetical protein [Vibrio cholerae]KNH55975.1 hypothetical protein A55_4299 [Vibrio cholerae 1587]TXZ90200.1 hypothetical protein FXE42_11145 [Vibrio cholerae]WOQ98303.1 hypothetical protein R4538_15960 [Vibrio cholerae]GHY70872.1 hypothetical protein VCSRO12_3565 [Vibrio cholerae]
MLKHDLLTLVIDEDANYRGGVRKITTSELSEFFRILTVSHSIAARLEGEIIFSQSNHRLNVRECLGEMLLLNSTEGERIDITTFSKSIDSFYQRKLDKQYLPNGLEVISISYNSPLKVVISGGPLKVLLFTVAVLGGEVNVGDFSVKMPGISEAVKRLSQSYLEVQKYKDQKKLAEKLIENHAMQLPHPDIYKISSLDNKI